MYSTFKKNRVYKVSALTDKAKTGYSEDNKIR